MFAAFDMAKDPFTTLEIVIKLGFERVLTSGQDSSALEGLPTIRQLVEKVSVSTCTLVHVCNSIIYLLKVKKLI